MALVCRLLQSALNNTTTMFGRHQTGFIFPMLLNVKALPTGFAGIMQKLHTTDNFIMYTSVTHRMLSVSQDTMRLFENLDVVAMGNGDVSLTKHVDGQVLKRLLASLEERTGRSDRVMHAQTVSCIARLCRRFR